jgi:thiazole synthase ThiGH ThiG subunit
MALAMKFGVLAGRLGYLAGKATTVEFAQPSSPITGLSK